MNSKIPWLVVVTAIIGSLILAAVFWAKLPDEMASHFNAAGQPDGWMAKTTFLAVMILVQAGMGGMLYGIGCLIRILPISMVNIPNREYWLADERKDQTLRESESMMAWIAAGTAIFMLAIFWLTLDANIHKEKALDSNATWIVMAVFLVGLFGFLFFKLKKYYRVPSDATN